MTAAPPAGATVREVIDVALRRSTGAAIIGLHADAVLAALSAAGLRIPPDAAPSSLVCVPREWIWDVLAEYACPGLRFCTQPKWKDGSCQMVECGDIAAQALAKIAAGPRGEREE